MSAFRDAISQAMHAKLHADCGDDVAECDDVSGEGWVGDAYVIFDTVADTALAMPEMQAMKDALRLLAGESAARLGGNIAGELRTCELPQSVVEWVLA